MPSKRKTTLELSRILSRKVSSIYGLIGLTQCEMISTSSAINLVPEIRFILDKLVTCDGAKVVRMSGSGATCFALFENFDLLQDAKR